MMSREECLLKSALCEANADQSGDQETRLAWLRLASDWRDMAGDGDAPATTARLMDRMRGADDILP